MAISAGTLLFRRGASGLEVLLVHPSGWYNARAKWGIPKGVPEKGEPLEDAARRETREETGIEPVGPLVPLGEVRYRTGKRIACFAGEAPPEPAPRCASWEVDRAEFVPLERAMELIHETQREFLERLRRHLEGSSPPRS